MMLGFPGTGKSSLMDNLLGKPQKLYTSTGVCESVVMVDINIEYQTTPSAAMSLDSDDSMWQPVECNDSFIMQLQKYTEIAPQQTAGLDEQSEQTIVFDDQVGMTTGLEATHQKGDSITELMKNVSLLLKNYKIKSFKDLKRTSSIYLRDTGGQVEFQEVLTILINGPSIFFFVFNVDIPINELLTVEYRKGTSEVINKYESSISTQQALIQTLASISAMQITESVTSYQHPPLVFIIGTHTDRLGSDAENNIAAINKTLDELITKNGFDDLVVYEEKDAKRVIFTVDNNKSPVDRSFRKIRSTVNKVITESNAFSIKYPVSSLLFSLHLQSIKKSILTRKECSAIAAKYGITGDKEVKRLLHFLHHRIGIIRFYDVDGLRHLVVNETQVLFDKVTDFMVKTFHSSKAFLPSELKKFSKGVLEASVFERVLGTRDKMTAKEFLLLLVHLHMIIPFEGKNGISKYFIPWVLNHLPELTQDEETPTDILPLTVAFKCLHCPKSLFGMVVIQLMMLAESKKEHEEGISLKLLEDEIYKDQVFFEININEDYEKTSIKMLESQLEVKFYPVTFEEEDEDRGTPLPKVCYAVQKMIKESIDRSLKELHYDKEKINPEIRSKCFKCKQLHPVRMCKGKPFIHCQKCHKNIYLCDKESCWHKTSNYQQPSDESLAHQPLYYTPAAPYPTQSHGHSVAQPPPGNYQHPFPGVQQEPIPEQPPQDDSLVQDVVKAIDKGELIKRNIAHIMLVGFPGAGKSTLMGNLLGKPKKVYPSTGVCEAVVTVDINNKDHTTLCAAMALDSDDSTWQPVECNDSFISQLHKCREGVDEHDEMTTGLDVQEETNTGYEQSEQTIILDKQDELSKGLDVQDELSTGLDVQDELSTRLDVQDELSTGLDDQVRTTTGFETTHQKDDSDTDLMKDVGSLLKNHKITSFEDLKMTSSIYLRDTGGQVEFQEILTILINGPSIFFFVFNTGIPINKPVPIEYRSATGDVINKYESSISTQQVLIQSLASISAMEITESDTSHQHQPLVFIIGTHTDHLGPDADKKIAAIDKILDELITKNGFGGLVVYEEKVAKRVIFAVDNNKSLVDSSFRKIRSSVNKAITESNAFQIEYPVSYLLFSLHLQTSKKSILTLEECGAIAAKYRITGDKEVKLLLHFLHHRIGIIRFYDVDGVRHLVVKETKVLFDKVTDLMVKTFPSSKAFLPGDLKESHKGIFEASVFERVLGTGDKMTAKEFLLLLVHLRIIISFKDKKGISKYFIPWVLNHLPELTQDEETPTDILPLTVAFKCLHCPKSLFGMVVIQLMMLAESKKEHEEGISLKLLEDEIYKDQVFFEININEDYEKTSIKMLESQLEVKFYPVTFEEEDEDRGTPLPKVCYAVQKMIKESIDRSLKELHYDKEKINPEIRSKCFKCKQLHPVHMRKGKPFIHCPKRNKDKYLCDNESCWHRTMPPPYKFPGIFKRIITTLATFLAVLLLGLAINYFLISTSRETPEFTPVHTDCPFTTSAKPQTMSLDSTPLIHEMYNFRCKSGSFQIIQRVTTDCYALGIVLEIPPEIVNIEWNGHGNNLEVKCSKIIERWLNGMGNKPITWRTFIKALKDRNLYVLAEDLEKGLCN